MSEDSAVQILITAPGGAEVQKRIDADIAALKKLQATVITGNADAVASFRAVLAAVEAEGKAVGASTLQMQQLASMTDKLNTAVEKTTAQGAKVDGLNSKWRTGANSLSVLALTASGAGMSLTGAAVAAGTMADAVAAVSSSARVAAAASGIGALVTVLAIVAVMFQNAADKAKEFENKVRDLENETGQVRLRTNNQVYEAEVKSIQSRHLKAMDAIAKETKAWVDFDGSRERARNNLERAQVSNTIALQEEHAAKTKQSALDRRDALSAEQEEGNRILNHEKLAATREKLISAAHRELTAVNRLDMSDADREAVGQAILDKRDLDLKLLDQEVSKERELESITSRTALRVADLNAKKDQYAAKLAEINGQEQIALRNEIDKLGVSEASLNNIKKKAQAQRDALAQESRESTDLAIKKLQYEQQSLILTDDYTVKRNQIGEQLRNELDAEKKITREKSDRAKVEEQIRRTAASRMQNLDDVTGREEQDRSSKLMTENRIRLLGETNAFKSKELEINSRIDAQIEELKRKGEYTLSSQRALNQAREDELKILEKQRDLENKKFGLATAEMSDNAAIRASAAIEGYNLEAEAAVKSGIIQEKAEARVAAQKKRLWMDLAQSRVSNEKTLVDLLMNSNDKQLKSVGTFIKNVRALELGRIALYDFHEAGKEGAKAIASAAEYDYGGAAMHAAAALEFAAAGALAAADAGGYTGGGGGRGGGGGGGGGSSSRDSSLINATSGGRNPYDGQTIKIEFVYVEKDASGKTTKRIAQNLQRIQDLNQPIRLSL